MKVEHNSLWLALLLLLPVPYVLTEVGWVPIAQLFVLGGVGALVWLVEGGAEAFVIGAVLLAQAALAAACCRFLAGRLLRAVPPSRRRVVVAVLVVALASAAQTPIYRTPLSNHAVHATVWDVFR